jgi:hypothetical protein
VRGNPSNLGLQEQILHNRRIVHLLYASPVRRGKKIEVIEDIPTFYDVSVTIRSNKKPIDVYLATQLTAFPFDIEIIRSISQLLNCPVIK